jgi:hypothetical protein
MLIHSLDDRNIPLSRPDGIQVHNPSDIVVWKVLGAIHTGADRTAREEFEGKVLPWFQSHSKPSQK